MSSKLHVVPFQHFTESGLKQQRATSNENFSNKFKQ